MPEINKLFTLYWIDGRKTSITGLNLPDAFTSAGYDMDNLKTLSTFVEDNETSFQWNKEKSIWVENI
jgi:hypothetical protein